jgi:hypothetical protein
MDVIALLERVRALNVEALVESIAGAGPAHVEPALRRSDGSLAVEGAWGLPLRIDFLRKGRESERAIPVTPARALSFGRFSLTIGDAEFDVGPFGWDWCEISTDLSPDRVGPALQRWFMEWFDPDDQNGSDSVGLYGVVHFASDPEPVGTGSKVSVDLGSAPVDALLSLLAQLSAAGVGAARIT